NAVRWLAQLAVNIVDYIDEDDYLTPFEWAPGEWVFGTELPRLVVNEVYADVAKSDDPSTPGMKIDRVRFWIELNNPMFQTVLPYNFNASWNTGNPDYPRVPGALKDIKVWGPDTQ